MSRIVDIEPVITKLENTQKQNVHIFSKRELVDAIADNMNLKPIDAVPIVRCKDCKHNSKNGGTCEHICISADDEWYCADGEKVTE